MKRFTRYLLETIVFLLVMLVLAYPVIQARVYTGENAGIAWNTGGIELIGEPGVFICYADWNTGERIVNPLAHVFPTLVVDC